MKFHFYVFHQSIIQELFIDNSTYVDGTFVTILNTSGFCILIFNFVILFLTVGFTNPRRI